MPEWRLTVDDKKYTFDVKMVTVEALTHIKAWYGKELGRYNNFIEAFFEGDPDAAKCAIWIARRAAGESNVPEPMAMDANFTLNQWLDTPEVEEEEDPNSSGATSPQTPASTETPENSGESSDGPSPQPSAGSSETSKSSGGSTSSPQST
jgi:hypothetical protein